MLQAYLLLPKGRDTTAVPLVFRAVGKTSRHICSKTAIRFHHFIYGQKNGKAIRTTNNTAPKRVTVD
jgi:hypothetical protein